jgi:hypothetical protein
MPTRPQQQVQQVQRGLPGDGVGYGVARAGRVPGGAGEGERRRRRRRRRLAGWLLADQCLVLCWCSDKRGRGCGSGNGKKQKTEKKPRRSYGTLRMPNNLLGGIGREILIDQPAG